MYLVVIMMMLMVMIMMTEATAQTSLEFFDFVKISKYCKNDICNQVIDSYVLSFAFFHTVCNKFKGSFRQLEYLYSVVVKKVG